MTNKELEACIEKYRGMLFRLAYSTAVCRSESEDIVEEAFIRLYTRKEPFESEEAEKAWLIRVTVNLCKNRNALKWNRSRAEADEKMQSGESFGDEFIDLQSALLKLKPDYRTVIYMYYYEGYRTDEIARLLGISATAVTTRLKRGRDKLKKFLEE